MTRIGITSQEVEEAAEIILSQGENPTIERIRRHLGTGSNSTITKYLNEWRTTRLKATTNQSPTSPTPPDPVHAAVNHVWEKIRSEAAAEIKTHHEKAQIEIEIAQAERNHANQERDQLQQELENHQKRLNQISADKEILALDLKTLQNDYLVLQEKLKSIEAEYNLFKQETANQITLLKSFNKNEIENNQTMLANLQKTHETSINKLVEMHENYRQQYLLEIDSYKVEKQQHKKITENYLTENQNLKEELSATKSQITVISLERDSAKYDVEEKNKIIANNRLLHQNIQSIMNEIENIKNLETFNKILLTLNQVNNKVDHHEIALSSISHMLTKSEEVLEG